MKLYFMVAAVLTALPASAQFYQRPPSVDQLLASTKAKPPEHHHVLRPKVPANSDVRDTRPFLGVEQPEKKEPEKKTNLQDDGKKVSNAGEQTH